MYEKQSFHFINLYTINLLIYLQSFGKIIGKIARVKKKL